MRRLLASIGLATGPVAIGPDNNVYVIVGDVKGHATKAQNFENSSTVDGTSGVLRVGKNGEESNETTHRTRTITLDQDTAITAYYDNGQAASNSQTNMINRLAGILNGQDCFNEKDQHKLSNAIGKIIQDIFGENGVRQTSCKER